MLPTHDPGSMKVDSRQETHRPVCEMGIKQLVDTAKQGCEGQLVGTAKQGCEGQFTPKQGCEGQLVDTAKQGCEGQLVGTAKQCCETVSGHC